MWGCRKTYRCDVEKVRSVQGPKLVAIQGVGNALIAVGAGDVDEGVAANAAGEDALAGERAGRPIPVGYAKQGCRGLVALAVFDIGPEGGDILHVTVEYVLCVRGSDGQTMRRVSEKDTVCEDVPRRARHRDDARSETGRRCGCSSRSSRFQTWA